MCDFNYLCQFPTRGEVTVTLPPKLELRCPSFVVANKSLELTLVSWGAVGVDVDWKIRKGDVQVAKGRILPQTRLHELKKLRQSIIISVQKQY